VPSYLLDLQCDGAGFHGTQIQASERTVQSVLFAALQQLDPAASAPRMASRLDQGVSARALPASCRLQRVWDPNILGLALNQHLPNDLVVTRVAVVADDFDCLGIPCTKHYSYIVRERAVQPVLDRHCWWIRELAQRDCLAALATHIPGRKDLSAFACLRHDGRDDHDPVRDYLSAAWSSSTDLDGLRHDFTISGRGFLYKQIRGLVGAMIHIALGRAHPDDFTAAIAAGRQIVRLGNTAPPEGLCLMHVEFDDPPAWEPILVRKPPIPNPPNPSNPLKDQPPVQS